jgi:endonuclease/exonuclease/phosphatase family metal-dependent hydrolase
MNIKVLTWNIRHGLTNEGYIDIPAFVEEAVSFEPDIILLQEVDRFANRSGAGDQVEEFRKGFGEGWESYWTKRLNFRGAGEYGICILSRFPIFEKKSYLLSDLNREACYAQEIIVEIDGLISVVNVHMPYDGYTGIVHTDRSWENLHAIKFPEDLILGGDMNVLPNTPEAQVFLSECMDIGEDRTTEFGRIDYCVGRGRAVPIKQEVMPSELSDHFPILTTFELQAK